MHHEDIKAAIRKQGVSPADIARHLEVTAQTVSSVIRGASKSERVASAIAKVCGIAVAQLWPGKYGRPAQGNRAASLIGPAAKAKQPGRRGTGRKAT